MPMDKCYDCKESIRYFTSTHGGQRAYNKDGSRHLCFPMVTVISNLKYISLDEILLPKDGEKIGGDATYAVYDGEFTRTLFRIHFYDGDTFLRQEGCTLDSVLRLQLKRALQFKADKPLPEPTLDTKYGWMDLRGNIYPCDFYGHISLAGRLEIAHKIENIEEAGFFKLSDRTFHNVEDMVTQRQLDAVVEYCLHHRIEIAWWAKDGESKIGTDDEVRLARKRRTFR